MEKEQEVLNLIGTVRSYETDLEGNVIPGTEVEDHNTINSDLKHYLANCLAANVNEAMDALFTGSTPATEIGAGRTDGIVFTTKLDSGGDFDATACFITTLNAGGAGTESYVEFYGYIIGAATLNGFLSLGYGLFNDGLHNIFASMFSSYAINKTVAANRRYHFYWKITIG